MISYSTVEAANKIDADLIIASTLSGYTARKVSNMKPNCWILATCTSKKTARSLALCYGVETTIVPVVTTNEEIKETAITSAIEKFNLKKNDKVIITGGFGRLSQKSDTNLMQIEII